jgi:hypothetical protein
MFAPNPTTAARALCALVAGSLCAADAAVYYVSTKGNDQNSGRSPEQAWRTVEPVNRTIFSPGDQILFAAGQTFSGPLQFDRHDRGTSASPILVSSFPAESDPPATLDAGRGRGIEICNASGFRISNLTIVGDGADNNTTSGILLLSTREEGAGDVEIDRVEVRGFGRHGISIGAWKTVAGYQNVQITNSSIHHNLRTGVNAWGPWGAGIYAHREIYIGDTEAYKMKGGSGLVFSSVDGGIIERCIVHNNGEEYSGGAGIWAWDSNNILFQFNESYENKTTGVDGDGFDFDGGVTNSVMQYNYSHDNDAAGYLLAQYRHAPQPLENIVIRYNISENDCRKKTYGAIHVWNGDTVDRIRNIQIYHNTVYLSKRPATKEGALSRGLAAGLRALGLAEAPVMPSAMTIISPTTGVSIFNNLFYTDGGARLVSVVKGQDGLTFQNNAYWAGDGAFSVRWKGHEYETLDDWLNAASTQERLGSRIIAVHVDPMLKAPGTGGTLGRAELLTTLEGYKLQEDSPLVERGLDLRGLGIDPGERGFFGTPISDSTPPAIGANLTHGS